MKVGDYVRTKDGVIFKLNSIIYEDDNYIQYQLGGRLEDKDNIKSSPNIIDLIEVGDYVNGYYVEDIRRRYDGEMITILEVATGSNYFQAPMYEEDIKSIVTKEQFESMEYKIGE